MPYEIDFHPVGSGSRSGDAITMRYWDAQALRWRVIVVDGGYRANGMGIVEHVLRVYGTRHVDFVVSTHPDNDHIGGLATVFEHLSVGSLWMHVPFFHAETLLPYFFSSRMTVAGLATRLRAAYPAVAELVLLASEQGTTLNGPFQGERIGPFTVLSPSVRFYEGLLPQFRDTPREDRNHLAMLGHLITGVGRRTTNGILKIVRENHFVETLREGGTTAAENESSVVLGGVLDDGVVLLTGDAGLRGLEQAADHADRIGLPLQDGLRVFQVPHHGSRNNVSPSILDRIVGPVDLPGSRAGVTCVVSAGPEDEEHPRQVVVNALIRRGLNPISTRWGPVLCVSGMPMRSGYGAARALQFEGRVEAYD